MLALGAGVQGLLGLGRGIFGGIQTAKANRELKNFRLPQYTIPGAYEDMMSLYRRRAEANELPGQSLVENKLGAQTAFGQRAAEKYAGTSGQALGAVTGLYGKQMDAVRDLGIQFANFKAQERVNLQGHNRSWHRRKISSGRSTSGYPHNISTMSCSR